MALEVRTDGIGPIVRRRAIILRISSAPLYLCSLIDGQSSLLSHLQIMSDRVCSRRLKRPERITISTYDANTEFSDASMDAARAF